MQRWKNFNIEKKLCSDITNIIVEKLTDDSQRDNINPSNVRYRPFYNIVHHLQLLQYLYNTNAQNCQSAPATSLCLDYLLLHGINIDNEINRSIAKYSLISFRKKIAIRTSQICKQRDTVEHYLKNRCVIVEQFYHSKIKDTHATSEDSD
ncbi:unnamed protein product [Didymodactylos carnosus]|uniref:Uncharacterized protein n=1 Tax=Didymodactylos carnosus TaxID=1234261 RepID=A0A8S2D9M3_9BILA|nr:unnamed protein product [Didymodactylos carnosus]CAF3663118.1 unnamed protein product [Didymodactylos carnosus]